MAQNKQKVKVSDDGCPQNHPCPVVSRCPVNAIYQEGYGLPKIDYSKCTGCLICTAMCGAFIKT